MKRQKVIAKVLIRPLPVPDGGMSCESKDFEGIFCGDRPDDVLYDSIKDGWTIHGFAVKDAPEDSALEVGPRQTCRPRKPTATGALS
jgi:hypothetical protein